MGKVRPIRKGLVQAAGECMACGKKNCRLDCHEILNGPLREKTLGETCSLLVLCWDCNSMEMTDKSKWPVARQLALLMEHSPEHYDIVRFNWLRNPDAPNYVTQDEVNEYKGTVRRRSSQAKLDPGTSGEL